MIIWTFERTGRGLNWTIERNPEVGEPGIVRFGWGQRSVAVQCLDRDEAEQSGLLKDGDWLDIDGKWLAFHRERSVKPGYHPWWRWGVAMGNRMWTLAIDGVNPDYDGPQASAIREADDDARRLKRGLPPRRMVAEEEDDEWGYAAAGHEADAWVKGLDKTTAIAAE